METTTPTSPTPPAPRRRHYRDDSEKFTPRNFVDECEEAGRPVPAAVRCPGCQRIVPPFVLVDVRALPPEHTDGQPWACDGCWTRWLRERRFDLVDWLGWHGAPRVVLERHAKKPNPFGARGGPPRDLARYPAPAAVVWRGHPRH